MTPDLHHLTADDLDALVTDQSSPSLVSHLATCAACARMVAADRALLMQLASLPSFDPTIGFPERVMAGIALPATHPLPMPVDSARAVAARRRAIGALALAGGTVVAGFAWATIHPSEAVRWSAPAVQGAGHALWVSLQHVVAGAIEQPWFATLRDAVTTPARALLVSGAIAGAYALALLGLRGLMTEPATDAGW